MASFVKFNIIDELRAIAAERETAVPHFIVAMSAVDLIAGLDEQIASLKKQIPPPEKSRDICELERMFALPDPRG